MLILFEIQSAKLKSGCKRFLATYRESSKFSKSVENIVINCIMSSNFLSTFWLSSSLYSHYFDFRIISFFFIPVLAIKKGT
jgi:hypothetical protein